MTVAIQKKVLCRSHKNDFSITFGPKSVMHLRQIYSDFCSVLYKKYVQLKF